MSAALYASSSLGLLKQSAEAGNLIKSYGISIEEILSSWIPAELYKNIIEKWPDPNLINLSTEELEELISLRKSFNLLVISEDGFLIESDIPKDIIEFLWEINHYRQEETEKILDMELELDSPALHCEYVDRLSTLPIICIKKAFSSDLPVEEYLREAKRCFCRGFDLACLALCRSTMEMLLEEEIKKVSGSKKVLPIDFELLKNKYAGNKRPYGKLEILILKAKGLNIITPELAVKCDYLRKAGGLVAHGHKSQLEAEEALKVVKEIVENIFR